ncbi:MAG: septation protein A [Sphingomonadaceae bacterium]
MNDASPPRPEAALPPAKPEVTGWKKLAIDFGPLVIFFLTYSRFDLFVATGAFMAASALAMLASWLLVRHIPAMTWFAAGLIAVFGGLTLWLQDETFIKVKPTILFAMFGAILALGSFRGRNYLRMLLGQAMPGLSDRGWALLQQRWAVFFFVLALLNEFFWRFTPTDIWIHFKVWGDTLLTFLFAIAQFPLLRRHGLKLD